MITLKQLEQVGISVIKHHNGLYFAEAAGRQTDCQPTREAAALAAIRYVIGDLQMADDIEREERHERDADETAESLEFESAADEATPATTYQQRMIRCGKERCKKCSGGQGGHGPYWYAFRREGGKVKSVYLGKDLSPEAWAEHRRTVQFDDHYRDQRRAYYAIMTAKQYGKFISEGRITEKPDWQYITHDGRLYPVWIEQGHGLGMSIGIPEELYDIIAGDGE